VSVEQANRIVPALAARRHLALGVDGARVIYPLWEVDGQGPFPLPGKKTRIL
jgi:hypothetical protein